MMKVINVCGSMIRTGTTTQCLQLCRFLSESGYRAAYAEMNRQNYIQAVHTTYRDVSFDNDGKIITFSGIDMIPRDMVPAVMDREEYDYLVCDYGNMNLRSFDRDLFLAGDAVIITGGVKPNEIGEFTRFLSDESMQNAIYILSFVPKNDEAMIRELMEEKSSCTLFSPYMPDPFGNYGRLYEEGGFFYALMDLVLYAAERKQSG